MAAPDQFHTFRFSQFDCGQGFEKSARDSLNEPADCTGQAESILEGVEKEAYTQGFRQGHDETLENEQEKLSPLKTVLRQSKLILAEHQTNLQSGILRDAIALALALADGVMRSAISKNPELSAHGLRQALQMVRGQEHIKIKAHPTDCDAIRILQRNVLPDTTDNIQIVADEHTVKGGCLIETDFGIIDARIDQQLATMQTALESLLIKSENSRFSGQDGPAVFGHLDATIAATNTIKASGQVSKVVGLVVEANGPAVQLGSMCDIYSGDGDQPIAAEVLGFRDRTVLMMPLEEIRNIGPGSRVVAREDNASIPVGKNLLGRIIDGLGNPIDGKGPFATDSRNSIYAKPTNPLLRQRIRKPLDLGIRSINGLLTVGCGQRMGIFAGSGVGKSVLMGMIARKSQADVNVIALIGERGRELNEFIDKELGDEGLRKSVVVVATSDHLPLVRVRGAFVATAIAEFFRDQGLHVNLMMDSLTRFAMAQREIGLALGEPPTTKGYTPSVFTLLPRLLERAGTSDHNGTITGLYTVLVEGDDMNEPIADAARSILDGHIVLSRELAHQNHYPAIDVLKSISRVMSDIASLQHKHNASRLKELLATYRKAEDLINIGAYNKGSNPKIDLAVEKYDSIIAYLRQGIQEDVNFEESLVQLDQLINASA
jgi:flagellum-specific ATP synthase